MIIYVIHFLTSGILFLEIRKQARHKALNAKRIRCLSATVQEQKEITDKQVIYVLVVEMQTCGEVVDELGK